MTNSTHQPHNVPPAQPVAYLHLRDNGRSTGRAQAAVHGGLIPNGDVVVALVRRSESVELVAHPELAQWCPDCLDENDRRVEARRENEQRVAAKNARAIRRDELLDELRDAARAADLASTADILVELDELDEIGASGEA